MRTTLADFLTEAQQQQVQDRGYFTVQGSDGGKYRIYVRSNSGNVHRWSSRLGDWVGHCAHPMFFPERPNMIGVEHDQAVERWIEESVITQKLIIERDEAYWLSIARRPYFD